MSRRVLILPNARNDLDRLAEFIASENPDAAERAALAIVDAVESLADFPERGRRIENTQRAELYVPWGRSGYVVQYRIDADRVLIARIFHGREQR